MVQEERSALAGDPTLTVMCVCVIVCVIVCVLVCVKVHAVTDDAAAGVQEFDMI